MKYVQDYQLSTTGWFTRSSGATDGFDNVCILVANFTLFGKYITIVLTLNNNRNTMTYIQSEIHIIITAYIQNYWYLVINNFRSLSNVLSYIRPFLYHTVILCLLLFISREACVSPLVIINKQMENRSEIYKQEN